MPPPPAELFATRIFLGPALRVQPDGRLVGLVREGYDSAFEEIVRRYRRPLERFAAAIVGGRCEDVTQDSFSKALQALRGSEAEIELRPWLYRIVRNTALNDLRDRGPAPEQLSEALAGAGSAAAEVERREELADLMKRLGALPEPQRAAIVMRELEGLSHEEIASALGVSGGAARQAIYRARAALRNGLGALVPLPLLRALVDHGGEAARGGAIAAGAGASSAGGALGGLGAGGALKLGAATLLVAGTVAGGVAIEQHRGGSGPETAIAAPLAEKKGAQANSAEGNSAAAGGSRLSHANGAGRASSDGPGGSESHSGPGSPSSISAGSGTRTLPEKPSSHSGSTDGGHGGSGSGDGESSHGGGEHSGLQTNGSNDGGGSGASGGSGSDDSSPSGGGGGGTDTGSGSDGGGDQTPTSEPVVEEAGGDTESSSGSEGSSDGSGDLTSSTDSTESSGVSDGSP